MGAATFCNRATGKNAREAFITVYLYERGGQVIGAVMTTEHSHVALLQKPGGMIEESSYPTLEQARAEVETLWDRNSK